MAVRNIFKPISIVLFSALPAVAAAKEVSPLPLLQDVIGNPDNFKLSGSVRLRYEALGGQSRVGLNAKDDLVSMRSTVFAEYADGPIRIGAELYDSRAYGGEAGSAVSANDVNALELVQAYVAADFAAPFGPRSQATLQAGRFMLNLGSRRLVAADEYRNTTNSYTGLRGDLHLTSGSHASLFYTLPQIRLPDDQASVLDNKVRLDRESLDLRLWGAFLAKPNAMGRTMIELAYVRLQERDSPGRPTRNRALHNLSARIMREPSPGKFDYEIETIYQFGNIRAGFTSTADTIDVSAGFIHADAGFTFLSPLKARLSVEYDRASGDGQGRKFGRFDTLFGMRRADLAPAGIYAQIGRANIRTPGIRIEMAPTTRLDGFAVYRAMWLANRTDGFSTTGVRDPVGHSGSFAGHQLEGRLRWWVLPKTLRAELNAAWIIKGKFLHDAPNAPATGNTRYASLSMMANF